MVFEAHGMSFPCTELLLFNYAKVNTVPPRELGLRHHALGTPLCDWL